MPLDEEGAKWSCEPCIRGHRSSKCQHFDRLMMKVPKAGRPLAKCPHPKGSCSCQRVYAFMVRIPKGSSCVCRPLYQVPAESAEASSASATSGTPSATPNPGRVQKTQRKQSNLHAAPDSIAKALKIEPQQTESNFNVAAIPEHPKLDADGANKSSAPQQMFQVPAEPSTAAPRPGGCCSGKSATITTPEPVRSCCAAPEHPQTAKQKAVDSAYASWAAPTHVEPLLWNSALQHGHYPSDAAGYNGISQQSPGYVNQPHAEATLGSQPQYMHSMQSQSSFDAGSIDQFSYRSSGYPFDLPSACTMDNSHDCSCGENCQCLGCASHPYNKTTTQHVQKMGFLVSIDGESDKVDQSTPFMRTESSPRAMSPNRARATSFADNTVLPSNFDSTFATGHHFMQPSEYYTLEYSVGLQLCSNVSGTCQCGNDCSCVGCLTHDGHNGIALPQPSPTEQHPEQQHQQGQQRGQHEQGISRDPVPQPHHDFLSYNTNIPLSLDQYSPSALSPPIVEAPFV